MNPLVSPEVADNARDVVFELIILLRVLENNQSRALNPT